MVKMKYKLGIHLATRLRLAELDDGGTGRSLDAPRERHFARAEGGRKCCPMTAKDRDGR